MNCPCLSFSSTFREHPEYEKHMQLLKIPKMSKFTPKNDKRLYEQKKQNIELHTEQIDCIASDLKVS